MKKTNEDLKWHVIYEGSGSITGNSWIEEVAYLGNEQWLLRIYADPAWSFDPDEPMLPEKKTSDELVTFVASIDAVSEEDALPRQKSLYDAAISAGAIQCIELLKESISNRVEESVVLALGPPRTIGKKNSSISIKTQKKAGEAMHTTGKVIRQGKTISIMEASPDHPIYKRGFVIGGQTLKSSSPATPETNLKSGSSQAPPKNQGEREASLRHPGSDPVIESLVQYRDPVSLQSYLDIAHDGAKFEDLPAEQQAAIPRFLLDPGAKPLDPSDPYYEEILLLVASNPLLTIERAREYLAAY